MNDVELQASMVYLGPGFKVRFSARVTMSVGFSTGEAGRRRNKEVVVGRGDERVGFDEGCSVGDHGVHLSCRRRDQRRTDGWMNSWMDGWIRTKQINGWLTCKAGPFWRPLLLSLPRRDDAQTASSARCSCVDVSTLTSPVPAPRRFVQEASDLGVRNGPIARVQAC